MQNRDINAIQNKASLNAPTPSNFQSRMLTFQKKLPESGLRAMQNKEEDAGETLKARTTDTEENSIMLLSLKKVKSKFLSFRERKGPFERMLMRGACLNVSTSEVMLMDTRMNVTMGMSS